MSVYLVSAGIRIKRVRGTVVVRRESRRACVAKHILIRILGRFRVVSYGYVGARGRRDGERGVGAVVFFRIPGASVVYTAVPVVGVDSGRVFRAVRVQYPVSGHVKSVVLRRRSARDVYKAVAAFCGRSGFEGVVYVVDMSKRAVRGLVAPVVDNVVYKIHRVRTHDLAPEVSGKAVAYEVVMPGILSFPEHGAEAVRALRVVGYAVGRAYYRVLNGLVHVLRIQPELLVVGPADRAVVDYRVGALRAAPSVVIAGAVSLLAGTRGDEPYYDIVSAHSEFTAL